MAYPYRVVLSEEQRAELRGLVGSGHHPAQMLTRARILLKADHGEGGPGWSGAAVAGALDVDPSTVLRVRRQFVTEGLAATLDRKRPDRVYERALDGEQEARLIALACSETPDGADHWSLRLLADQLVRLEVVAAISHETVRQTLKKTNSSRGW
jgi:Homeodomain-like domain